MSATSQKGHLGEAGVRDFLRMWYAHVPHAVLPEIIPSAGMNDEGDISAIPCTCIEVKNHANPVVGTLMNNAAWKAANSRKPIWFLAYKRAGFSPFRAWAWHTCSTVDNLLEGFAPVDDTGAPAFTVEQVPDLCQGYADIRATMSRSYGPLYTPAVHPWSLKLMFRPYGRNVQQLRDAELRDQLDGEAEPQVVPLIVSPRTGTSAGSWYQYTLLSGRARMLETLGLLPQDVREYQVDQPQEMSQQ